MRCNPFGRIAEFSDIEIIVVDDGSDDGTRSAVSAIEDDRIIYLWQKHAGVSSARNEGVLNSRGKFVAFLDSDDVWLPEKSKNNWPS